MPEKMIKLSELKVNDRNPRKISDGAFGRLCKSIKRDPRFMEFRPIVVDEDNVILGGNQRYRALVELGRKEVPESWVYVARGLTPTQRNRFVLVDNSPEGMSGYWDYDLLQEDYTLPKLEDLGFAFPEDIDPNKIWEGMPTFEQTDREFYKSVIVRFMTREDYERFSKLINQTLTAQTKYIWYPPQDFDTMGREVEFVEEK